MKVMIASALLAAILYGVGAALEQRQAARTASDAAGRPRLLVLLIRRPLWLLGLGAQFGGFVAHAVALRFGPLAVVQMLVATELIVSIVLVSVWSGRRLNRSSWAAALLVVAGTAAFMTLTAPTSAADAHGHGMPPRALFAVAALGMAAAGMTAVGLGAAGRRRAVLLAVAAGLADAASAVVTMSFSQLASHGLVAVVTSWPVYAVVTCGVANVLLTQTAYQTDLPMITLPVISAITPMASVVIGVGLLGEAHHVGAAAGVGAAGAALATGLALAVLARSAPSAHVGLLASGRHGDVSVGSASAVSRHTVAPAAPPLTSTSTGRHARTRLGASPLAASPAHSSSIAETAAGNAAETVLEWHSVIREFILGAGRGSR